MDDTAKKETLEEAKKDEKKIELTDEEAEKIAGGASFGFYDREKRKPKWFAGKRVTAIPLSKEMPGFPRLQGVDKVGILSYMASKAHTP